MIIQVDSVRPKNDLLPEALSSLTLFGWSLGAGIAISVVGALGWLLVPDRHVVLHAAKMGPVNSTGRITLVGMLVAVVAAASTPAINALESFCR